MDLSHSHSYPHHSKMAHRHRLHGNKELNSRAMLQTLAVGSRQRWASCNDSEN